MESENHPFEIQKNIWTNQTFMTLGFQSRKKIRGVYISEGV